MEYAVIDSNDVRTLVALRGRLDTPGVAAVETGLTAAIVPRRRSAILDLSGVSFVSSLGIRTLLAIAKSLAPSGRRLVLAAPQPLVAEALEQALGGQVLPIVPELAEAERIVAG